MAVVDVGATGGRNLAIARRRRGAACSRVVHDELGSDHRAARSKPYIVMAIYSYGPERYGLYSWLVQTATGAATAVG